MNQKPRLLFLTGNTPAIHQSLVALLQRRCDVHVAERPSPGDAMAVIEAHGPFGFVVIHHSMGDETEPVATMIGQSSAVQIMEIRQNDLHPPRVPECYRTEVINEDEQRIASTILQRVMVA